MSYRYRSISLMLLLIVLGMASALPVWGVETFTIGGSERSWRDFGTTPGGVIDFVDELGEVRDVFGEQIFGEAPDSSRGWIMPLRLRPDFNISPGVLERGGSIDVPNLARNQRDQDELEGMLSGDHRLAFDRKFVEGRVVLNNGIKIRLDLGARFGVNRIVFYPRDSPQFPFGNDFLRGYELFLNDGLPENLFGSGQPIFTSPVVREADNSDTTVVADIEPQFVRFIELRSITTLGFEIDEIEVYGTGFVPVASYVSGVLDLEEEVVWGTIRWIEQWAGRSGDSKVEVRVRSGRDTTPDVYYRSVALGGGKTEIAPTTSDGDTLTQTTYEKLQENEQGPIKVDVENWSQWQIVANQEELNLPAPRRYFQFRIDFANRNLEAGRAIDDLSFEFARPPVDRIVAEVEPARTQPGAPTTFTYVVRIANTTGKPGFARFEIETPARVTAIRTIEVMDREGNRLSGAEFDGELEALPSRVGEFAIEEVEDDHFTLGLPRLAVDGTLLRIVFDAAVFRYGTRFQGRAFADETAVLPLQTEGGDASPELDTNELLVRVSVGSKVAGSLEIHPAAFTPNGDGINDVAEVAFTVLHLLQPSPVEVVVYDLAGRRIRKLSADRMQVQSGRFPLLWDGRGDGGGLVPPGLYLVEIKIHSDQRIERRIGRVAVVY